MTLSRLRRIRVATESSFGVEMSGAIASFLGLHAMHAHPAATSPERLPDEGVVQRRWDRRKSHEGPERPTLDLRTYLSPPQTALNASATPTGSPADAFGTLLVNLLGGFDDGAGSTEAGSSTTDVLNVTTGHGSRFTEAGAVGATVNGLVEARYIADITTDAITPLFAFSAAPTGSSAVYNAYSYYLSADPDKSSQIIVEGADRDDIHWLLGMQKVPAFDVQLNMLPTMSVPMQGADYVHDDDVGTPLGGSALAAESLTDGSPVRVQGAIALGSGSAPIAWSPLTASIQVIPQWTIEPIEGLSGKNGIVRWGIVPAEPSIRATVMVEGFGTAYQSARDAGTTQRLMVQVGNEAAGIVLITLPSLQIDSVEPVDYGPHVGTQLELSAITTDVVTSTAQGQSPIVISRV